MQNTPRTGILYWGKRGGGNRFAMNVALGMEKSGVPFILVLSDHNENLDLYRSLLNCEIVLVSIDTSWKSVCFGYFGRNRKFKILIAQLHSRGVVDVVCMMPHIFDLQLHRITKALGMKLSRIIHDFKRHPGDLWPNKISIFFRIKKSDNLFFLSKYVAQHTNTRKLPGVILPFPEEFLVSNEGENFDITSSCDVLITGRMRKYKGLNQIPKIIEIMNQTFEVNFRLVGSGRAIKSQCTNLITNNHWLSEKEFEDNIRGTKILLLLHTEASQSGLIPLAHRLGKWVVAPRIGGLGEQVHEGLDGFIYEPGSIESATEAIKKALELESQGVKPKVLEESSFIPALFETLNEKIGVDD